MTMLLWLIAITVLATLFICLAIMYRQEDMEEKMDELFNYNLPGHSDESKEEFH